MKLLLLVLGAAALGLYGWYDVFLLTGRLSDVQGNLEAAVVWATPAFVVGLWRFERQHQAREAAAQARHEERLRYLDSIDAKVDQLHQHLGVPHSD